MQESQIDQLSESIRSQLEAVIKLGQEAELIVNQGRLAQAALDAFVMQRSSTGKHVCQTCGKNCRNGTGLSAHMRAAHP